jgi:hypothetical protein
LYLEEGENDIDLLVNNLSNFYYWCATRVLTLDRVYAKEILNSIGVTQAVTDRDRAQIALSYHCLTLTDVFWVRNQGEKITFQEINLYENHLDNAFVDVALRGRQMTLQNSSLIADDVSTNGCFPKAWIRQENDFYLYKDGNPQVVENEILASQVCQCFQCNQVRYERGEYDKTPVSVSKIMTSTQFSIVSREAFEIYAANREMNAMEYILRLDAYSYYMMNILDYLVGNTDRHWGNWGFLVDNRNNKPLRLHDLMDFNQAFHAYDTIDGAGCQTTLDRSLSQKDAAVQAVREIGLNQISEIDVRWFSGKNAYYEMLMQRLDILKRSY